METKYFDLDAEKSFIAATIWNAKARTHITDVDADDFYDVVHRSVFTAIRELYIAGEEIDLLAIRAKVGDHVDDKTLAEFGQAAPSYNIKSLINTIERHAKRRKLFTLSTLIRDRLKAGEDTTDISSQIDDTVRELDKINAHDMITCEALFENWEDMFNIVGRFVKTDYEALDSKLIGLFKGELSILAARPGIGKTALAVNIAQNVAKKEKVIFISLEMSLQQLGRRMISATALVDSTTIGEFESDRELIKSTAKKLQELNLTFFDNCFSLDHIVSQIRKYNQMHEIGLIVIDYLQLIQTTVKGNRYLQVGEISRRLKLLTRELDVTILCLAQLNRAAEDRVPKLSDLRESGDIEQDADVVLFIHKEPMDKSENVNILFAKNRNGKADTMSRMIFKKKFTRFNDEDTRHNISNPEYFND
jgi:replicative DNA helicase